ncbi:prolyl oligopeptidase family serine peptidase [Gelidibacter sp. F63206]|uniref:S9 family peptidase n=1 Tax=Gelidibacter sp. F63206 TaxID=2926425 RepID=UPI001FF632AF|nr:prolyl oligopeptidase family serine peptidase [Gelidibacter sp. F63206]MCK0115117.1 prolyl oligopeptidase family serine peptidase [Gelidibacter sp. F63206]
MALKAFLLLWLLSASMAHCQKQAKLELTMEDYDRWSTLVAGDLSVQGTWLSYRLTYNGGIDTLFVKGTKTEKIHTFPQGNKVRFGGDEKWALVFKPNSMVLMDLAKGEQMVWNKAISGQFMGNSKFVLFEKVMEKGKELVILELASGRTTNIGMIKEYTVSPNGNKVAYILNDNTVALLNPGRGRGAKVLFRNDPLPRKHLVWNQDSDALAFLEELIEIGAKAPNHRIHFIKDLAHTTGHFILDPTSPSSPVSGKTILYNRSFTPLAIAPDNENLIFYLKGEQESNLSEEGVQVWRSTDRLEYPRNLLEGNPKARPKLSSWFPKTDRLLKIMDNERYGAYLTADKKKAIVFDPHRYEPQPESYGPTDLWVMDLVTGNREFIVGHQSYKTGFLGASPNSRYINYYKNGQWWGFDFTTGHHVLLSPNINDLEQKSYPGAEQPSHGVAGWTTDSKFLIVHSEYDIWLLSPNGREQILLTDGKSQNIRYRVVTDLNRKKRQFSLYDPIGLNFDLGDGLVIESFDLNDKSMGYYRYTSKGRLKKMVMEKAKLAHLKKAVDSENFIYTLQRADLSPQLLYMDVNFNSESLVRTNTQQENYGWGKTELIAYSNSAGDQLQGVLHYPAGYIEGRQYPMVVNIYETQSQYFHNYFNPTVYNTNGFCPTIYTTDGYLVLYPDITYQDGEPGPSAVDCVEAAVKKAVDMGVVDKDHIGLIGYSFGGYQTVFIVSQSNTFAAAVSGCGYVDLVGNSLFLEKGTRSNMWRYQTHQKRMGASLYDDFQGFVENSPITYAENITTPLMSVTGTRDTQVDPQESMKLHLALRSLKKEHTLLLYPGEGHAITTPKFQKDLTLKTKAWFDYYLKKIPIPEEMGL